jgi:hypothetical protein
LSRAITSICIGNTCTRIFAPPGLLEIRNEFLIADSGLPDEVAPQARQLEVGALPDEVLIYLLGSRYCDTEKLSNLAWSLFGGTTPGWQRVQAICDYAHDRICSALSVIDRRDAIARRPSYRSGITNVNLVSSAVEVTDSTPS